MKRRWLLVGMVMAMCLAHTGRLDAQDSAAGSGGTLDDIKRRLEAELQAQQEGDVLRLQDALVRQVREDVDAELDQLRDEVLEQVRAQQDRAARDTEALSALKQSVSRSLEQQGRLGSQLEKLQATSDQRAEGDQAAELQELRSKIQQLTASHGVNAEEIEALRAAQAATADRTLQQLYEVEAAMKMMAERRAADLEQESGVDAAALEKTLLESLDAFSQEWKRRQEAEAQARAAQADEERQKVDRVISALAADLDRLQQQHAKVVASHELAWETFRTASAAQQAAALKEIEARMDTAGQAGLTQELRAEIETAAGEAMVGQRAALDAHRAELESQLRARWEQFTSEQVQVAAATGQALGEFKARLTEDLRSLQQAEAQARIDEMAKDLAAFQRGLDEDVERRAIENAELIDKVFAAERTALDEQRKKLEAELNTQRENDAKARVAQAHALRQDLEKYRRELAASLRAEYEAEAAARTKELEAAKALLASVRSQLEVELRGVREARQVIQAKEEELETQAQGLQEEREGMTTFKERLQAELDSWFDAEAKTRESEAEKAQQALEEFQQRRNDLLQMAPPASPVPTEPEPAVAAPTPGAPERKAPPAATRKVDKSEPPQPKARPRGLLDRFKKEKSAAPAADVVWPE